MCLITNQQEPLIAEEDMTVYKILRSHSENLWSVYRDFRWDLDRLYETKICENEDWIGFDDIDNQMTRENYPDWVPCDSHPKLKCFGSGFHATLTKERLENLSQRDYTIFECTIPKGSEYYINFSDLVVSNQIIINKK